MSLKYSFEFQHELYSMKSSLFFFEITASRDHISDHISVNAAPKMNWNTKEEDWKTVLDLMKDYILKPPLKEKEFLQIGGYSAYIICIKSIFSSHLA